MSTSSADRPAATAELPLLAPLAPEARRLVEESFVDVSFPFGAVIVREGELADAYYVIVGGRARVIKRGSEGEEIPINSLAAGDGFGEVALVESCTRTATVRASSEVRALRLDRGQANAAELARRLDQHPAVSRVRYPGLPGDPGTAPPPRR